MSSDRAAAGLGLVEVAVALFVLAGGLLALASLAAAVGAHTKRSVLHTEQTLVARERLEQILSDGWAGAAPGRSQETVVRKGTRWELVVEVSELSPGERLVDLVVSGPPPLPDLSLSVGLAGAAERGR